MDAAIVSFENDHSALVVFDEVGCDVFRSYPREDYSEDGQTGISYVGNFSQKEVRIAIDLKPKSMTDFLQLILPHK